MTARERAYQIVLAATPPHCYPEQAVVNIEKAITAAVEEEREACAKMIEEDGYGPYRDVITSYSITAQRIAEDIRKRCNTYATENTSTHQKCG